VDIDDAGIATGWARLRRPDGLVEQTRWMLWLAVLVALLLTLPWAWHSDSPASPQLAVAAGVLLVGCWTYRYWRRSSPLLLDLGEVSATAALAVAAPAPSAVLGFVLLSLWYRALYGNDREVTLFAVGLVGAIIAAIQLWGLLPGRDRPATGSAVLASLPVMLLTMLVARHLARGLFTREQSQQRDSALVRLGNDLVGVTDKETIYARSTDCCVAICDATPGIRALAVLGSGDGQLILVNAGTFHGDIPPLPQTIMPTDATTAVARPLLDSRALDRAAGERCAWLALPLPEEPDGWILLGAPQRVPPEAVAAMQSMINHVVLAMRTRAAHHDLATQARMDALTGLANRAAFTSALSFAIADPDRHLALLFIDLDNFKIVNDRLGHAAGDELLRVVALRLRASIRPDDLCARLGGDEFAVLLQDAEDTADAVAHRLVHLIAAPVSLGGRIIDVGASIGLAFAVPGTSAERLVQHADIAMYAAKANGKNRVQIFDPSLLLDDGKAAFEAELAGAADAGQLVVHYQPIVSVLDGSCVAVEALVRWQHPTRGLLSPAEFIPQAERTGAIISIGAFVLRQACTDSMDWAAVSGRLLVHVNVSAAQLTHPDFLGVVRACLAEFAMAPQQLVLEITESMVLDSPAIRAALDRLAAIGAAIAIDDFGTGYSALSTLRALPLDIVKLDKSFIAGGSSNATDEAVVGAIVQMAGRLGLRIVAEGVERLDQQQFLEQVGADAAQGFLHLRPTPAPEFGVWLRQRAAPVKSVGNGSVIPIGPRRSL
jgi:diguanylate cyclase (GGDEF)-like protein